MQLRLTILLLLISAGLFGQNELPIGTWRTHLPYRAGDWVTQSQEHVYYATENALIKLRKDELSQEYITTVDGLSSADIKLIEYNDQSDVLMVVYNDASLDLVSGNEVRTLNQIANFTNIAGEKSINHVFMVNEWIALLATSYGISAVNLEASEFTFTTFTGISVSDVYVFEGIIYATTEEGIYQTPLNNPNPLDFGTWSRLASADGFPEEYSAQAVTAWGNQLYVSINDSVFVRSSPTSLEYVTHEQDLKVQYLAGGDRYLLIGFRCFDNGCAKVRYYTTEGETGYINGGCVGVANNAVEDQDGRIWFGDDYRGIRRVNGPDDAQCSTIQYNSPYSNNVLEVDVLNNQVWIATGGLKQAFSNRFSDHGFASLIDGQWDIYNRWFKEGMRGQNTDLSTPAGRDDDPLDIVSVIVHPTNGKVYAASYYEGLLEVNGETMTHYNTFNSPLQPATGDMSRVRIGGLDIDADGTLWMTNNQAADGKPIASLRTDGTWATYGLGCNETQIYQLAVDNQGHKWATVIGISNGLIVFSENEADNAFDDECRRFNQNNSALPTNDVRTVEVDLNGDVWVGTTAGIVIFECGANVFNSSCIGRRPIVQQDGFGAFLLETEEVRTIAVDGANRKWIGTQNGVFLLSPDGQNQLLHLTTSNSPLLSDLILDIAINDETGEIFFATEEGLISYQGEAVIGGKVNKTNPLVFPNPVRPDYLGPIAIRGLAKDANVKITDVSGKLVFETKALGGQAIWDGNDYRGNRAQTGVYLVFASSDPGGFSTVKPDAVVTKIMFIR